MKSLLLIVLLSLLGIGAPACDSETPEKSSTPAPKTTQTEEPPSESSMPPASQEDVAPVPPRTYENPTHRLVVTGEFQATTTQRGPQGRISEQVPADALALMNARRHVSIQDGLERHGIRAAVDAPESLPVITVRIAPDPHDGLDFELEHEDESVMMGLPIPRQPDHGPRIFADIVGHALERLKR